MIRAFFNLQVEKPTQGDWASGCMKDLEILGISYSLTEIENMSYKKFKNIVKEKIREKGFTYLTKNVRSKGRENICQELSMAEYLLPETKMLSIEEKQRLFQVKNKMCQIPSNFPKKDTKYYCFCGNEETMDHIYRCEMLRNGNNQKLEYEKIYTGTISEQIEIFRIFETNMKVRETLKNNIQIPCGLQGDPLSVMSVMGIKY